MTSLLFDISENFKPDMVFIVGNGAIEGPTWKPVGEMKKQIFNTPFFHKFPAREINFQEFAGDALSLAQLVFIKRICESQQQKGDTENGIRGVLELVQKSRINLSQNYEAILKELSLRPLPDNVDKWLKTSRSNIGVITTNWEPTVYNSLKYPTIFLHGNIKEAQSILLPTEIANEFNNEHMTAHSRAQDWISHANHLIVWGVSFHEYDAELASILMTGEPAELNHRTLTVINPNSVAQQQAIALAHITADPVICVNRNIITSNRDLRA